MTSRDPKSQGHDAIIFEAALKLFNFYHWLTQLTQLIYTDFTVSCRDALDRLRVRLNSILFSIIFVFRLSFQLPIFCCYLGVIVCQENGPTFLLLFLKYNQQMYN